MNHISTWKNAINKIEKIVEARFSSKGTSNIKDSETEDNPFLFNEQDLAAGLIFSALVVVGFVFILGSFSAAVPLLLGVFLGRVIVKHFIESSLKKLDKNTDIDSTSKVDDKNEQAISDSIRSLEIAKFFQTIVHLENKIHSPNASVLEKTVNFIVHGNLTSLVKSKDIHAELCFQSQSVLSVQKLWQFTNDEGVRAEFQSRIEQQAQLNTQKNRSYAQILDDISHRNLTSTNDKVTSTDSSMQSLSYVLKNQSLDALVECCESIVSIDTQLGFATNDKSATKALAEQLSTLSPSIIEMFLHGFISSENLKALLAAGLSVEVSEQNMDALSRAYDLFKISPQLMRALEASESESVRELHKRVLQERSEKPSKIQTISDSFGEIDNRLQAIDNKVNHLLNTYAKQISLEELIFLKQLKTQGLKELSESRDCVVKLTKPNLLLQENLNNLLLNYESHLDKIEESVQASLQKTISTHSNYLKMKQN